MAAVFRKSATALITGSASGIGLAVAHVCRSHGMNLALVDANAALLAVTAQAFAADASGAITESYAIDVGDLAAWRALRPRLEQRFTTLELLHLNAGVALKSGWEDAEYFQKIFQTNVFGVTNALSTLLPLLSPSPTPSAIVITGSKQGITNPPGNPAYNASKAAVRSLAESLSFELAASRPDTAVHLLVPGWTFTGLTGGGTTTEKPAGAWSAAQVADYLETKMGEGQFYVICPDNDVTVEMDGKRVLWGAGDLVEGRPPLSRWREGWKDRAAEAMK